MCLMLLCWYLCIWCYFVAWFIFLISYIPSVEVFAVFRWDLDEHLIEKIIPQSRSSEYQV